MGEKRVVERNANGRRLNVYGGFADLVNGHSDAATIDRALKFAALFYEHLIVPDGFFHCYGPISSYAAALSPQSSNLAFPGVF